MARPEQQLQIRLVHALKLCAPDVLVFHPANGGSRDKREAALLKAMGVVPGVCDLVCCWAFARVGFMELKSDKGALTPLQSQMIDRLKTLGFPVAVVRSIEEALQALEEWGAPLRGRVAV